MILRAAFAIAASLLLAGPACAGDLAEFGHGRLGSHHHAPVHAGAVHEIAEYREPYLPRGVLYNAPPLPVRYGHRREYGYGDVISARY